MRHDAPARVHPRIRGEYSLPRFQNAPVMGSPPHTRGILLDGVIPAHRFRFTPAYAGNTRFCHRSSDHAQVHPRIRGEYSTAVMLRPPCLGSPPHTRGIPLCFNLSSLASGFTPAYAGNTTAHRSGARAWQVHPRIRGEYRPARPRFVSSIGSPPHTRGILYLQTSCAAADGFTPAYAGNTTQLTDSKNIDKGSPPHTRGILSNVLSQKQGTRFTPAYAGNTLLKAR